MDNRRTGLITVSGGVFALAAFVWLYGGRATPDDLFIYMRYADNLLNGVGVVYNQGQRSLGVTSLTWFWLMSGVAAVCGNAAIAWKLAGVAAASIGFGLLLARFRDLSWFGALAIAAFAFADPFTLRWCASGMENSLAYSVTALLTLAVFDFWQAPSRSRAMVLCGLAAMATFTRPELGVLAAGVSLAVAATDWRSYWRIVMGEAAAVVIVLMAVYGSTGYLLPQTGAAKALLLHQNSALYAPTTLVKITLAAAPGALIAPLLLGWRDRGLRAAWAAAWFNYLVIFAYFATTQTLVSTRYSVAYIVPLLCAGALTLHRARLAAGRWTGRMLAVAAVQGAACAAALIWMAPGTAVDDGAQIRPIGEWARTNLPPARPSRSARSAPSAIITAARSSIWSVWSRLRLSITRGRMARRPI